MRSYIFGLGCGLRKGILVPGKLVIMPNHNRVSVSKEEVDAIQREIEASHIDKEKVEGRYNYQGELELSEEDIFSLAHDRSLEERLMLGINLKAGEIINRVNNVQTY